jgi:ATP-dependent Clp protease ATP-binding subunit ClpC
MFERFTPRARQAVVLAQEEARRLGHNYIGTEHVLLGLPGDPGCTASRALDHVGMSLDSTRDEVAAMVGTGSGSATGHIPFTPPAKKTLELALREALQLHHDYIGTEHILLGVIREGHGPGAQILRQHSPGLTLVRVAVLELVCAEPPKARAGLRWPGRR